MHTLLQDKMLPRAVDFGSQIDTWGYVVMIVVFVALIILTVRVYNRSRINNWRYKGSAVGNEEIFERLCEANNLTSSEIFLVRKLVFDLKLDNPLLPFVSTKVIDEYKRGQNRNKQGLLDEVKAKIFA